MHAHVGFFFYYSKNTFGIIQNGLKDYFWKGPKIVKKKQKSYALRLTK